MRLMNFLTAGWCRPCTTYQPATATMTRITHTQALMVLRLGGGATQRAGSLLGRAGRPTGALGTGIVKSGFGRTGVGATGVGATGVTTSGLRTTGGDMAG